jgi:hypothetical protein
VFRTSSRRSPKSIVEARTPPEVSSAALNRRPERRPTPVKQTYRVVCFSETPLEHIYSLVADINGRRIRLRPYGLAMTKLTARRMGISPIWYVNQTPGFDWKVTPAVNALKKRAGDEGKFHKDPIAQLTRYLESMGTWSEDSRKEFWWEREWRLLLSSRASVVFTAAETPP